MAEKGGDAGERFEGLLRPWFFPFLGATAAAAVGIFWSTGMVAESTVGALVVVLVPLTLALMVARPALGRGLPAGPRALVAAAALLTFVVSAVPALEAVRPGDPVLVGELSREGQGVSLPQGIEGRVMVLASAKLGGGEAGVAFRLSGFEPAVEGRLERTYATARVGRGGSTRVARDHDSDWYEARIPAGAREIRLERVQGLVAGPLRIAVFREWIPRPATWALAALALGLAAAADILAGAGGGAVAAGVALGFGLVVSHNVTPARSVVPSLWAVVLGAIAGAPAAVVVRLVLRRLLPRGRGGRATARGRGRAGEEDR